MIRTKMNLETKGESRNSVCSEQTEPFVKLAHCHSRLNGKTVSFFNDLETIVADSFYWILQCKTLQKMSFLNQMLLILVPSAK